MQQPQNNPEGLLHAARMVMVCLVYITIIRGVRSWLGDEFLVNMSGWMFGGYVDVWNKHAPAVNWHSANPYFVMFVGLMASALLFNFVRLGRYIGALVAALFIWGVIFTQVSNTSEYSPSPLLIGGGIGSIFFLVVSSFASNSISGISRFVRWFRS